MDRIRLGVRIADLERVLDSYDSAVLGNSYRATLPAGRIARLLVSLQGQDVVSMSTLESIAYKQVHISSLELRKAYLPLFSEWGFARIYDDRIEETVKSRSAVLDQVGQWWEQSKPHEVERLSVELFDTTAVAPVPLDNVKRITDNYDSRASQNAMIHLRESGLVDKLRCKDTDWFYSPEVFGENYPKTIKYLENQSEKKAVEIRSVIEKIMNNEGLPHDSLKNEVNEKMIDEMTGSGLLMGFPVSIGGRNCPFYFTPDVRNRFDREGRGDKFELIKAGISHFQYAFRLAEEMTGKLKFNPSVFLNRLIDNGKAGDATAIGTDYDLLVKSGLVKIENTYGNRYRFILPESKEKIADLEAIRDAFQDKWVMPQINLSTMGIPCEVIPGDSIVYRATKAMQAKELAREFAKDVFIR